MKKIKWICTMALTIMIIAACKKTAEAPPALDEKPTPTAVGMPLGLPATKNIGSGGGMVISDDGKIELQIPAGALSSNTDISIQAVSNNAPNGVGNAYRFSPDGQKFANPVTLKIHYTSEEASESLPALMGIAYQDSTGIWWRVNNFSNDVANKIISAPIMHFSDWSEFEAMRITPASASIGEGESIPLEIQIVNTGGDEEELAPLFKKTAPVIWEATDGSLDGTDDLHRIYTAPATVPAQNPVAVTAQVNLQVKYHGESFDKLSLVANIIIGGEYDLVIVSKEDILQKDMWMTDSATMHVKFAGESVLITNIQNYSPLSFPASVSDANCTYSYLPENTGTINITKATAELRIQSATERGIQFFFTHSGTREPGYSQSCPMPAPQPPFEASLAGETTEGEPLSLFFDLTGPVMHDDLSMPGYSLTATLTMKKN